MLRNAGTSPIVPSEYHENLGVTVSKPRHIVAVENSSKYFPDAVQLRWRRISETKFEADPALLNPSDIVSTSVYLTNAKSGVYETDKAPEIDVKWKARITNLRGFYEPPDPLERMKERYFGIHVELQGWALPFTVICALLFQAVHLRLLSRAGFLRDWSGYSIGVILCASLLSFAAAESSATYIFGSNLTDLMGINHWLNLPPILANIVALIYFDRQARTRTDFAPKAS